jgi:hypothetical protein
MIISEKQILTLITIAQLHLKFLGEVMRDQIIELSEPAKNNVSDITDLLNEITEQQSKELKVIE